MNGLEEWWTHQWHMLIDREYGPLHFRFALQPLVAALLAIRVGIRDARAGRPAYGWTLTTDPLQRRELIRQGWKDMGKLFIVAIIIDMIYEVIVFRWIHPVQSLIVAAVIAFPAYFFIRGLANRIARRFVHTEQQTRALRTMKPDRRKSNDGGPS